MSPSVSCCVASIIIPTLCRPVALRAALRSLLVQNEPQWEAWVVDDGSGEGLAVVQALGDARIRAIANPGQGQVDARNAAIVLARGEYICWLDDDDGWDDPSHLRLLRMAAAQGPAVFHRGGWLVSEHDEREVFDWDASPASLRDNNTVLTSSIAYPRAAHRTIGLLDRSVGGYCDWDVLLRLCQAGLPVRKLPGLGVRYRIHAGGASARPQHPERVRMFERFQAKHGLHCVMHNHSTMARALAAPTVALG